MTFYDSSLRRSLSAEPTRPLRVEG